MCFGNSGGLGKLFAPLASTGLDPVGKATNKALGLEEKKKKDAVAIAPTESAETLSSALEKKRKLSQGTVLETASETESVLASAKNTLG